MKAKKILSIIGCFTLTAVTCVCMLFSVGCSKNEPKKEADGLIITPGEVQGDMISLLTQGPTDGTTEYTLTVVLNADCPDDMKAIDWSIAWKDPSSEWATGKVVTDYVTVTPTADGALTAKVKKVVAFGEQVIVTATSRVVTSLKATATVDCLKEVTVNYTGTPNFILGQTIYFDSSKLSYGVGTLSPECSGFEFTLTSFQSPSLDDLTTLQNSLSEVYGTINGQPKVIIVKSGFKSGEVFSLAKMFKFNSNLSESEITKIKNGVVYKQTWNKILGMFGGPINRVQFSYDLSYNSKVVKTISIKVAATFDIRAEKTYDLVTNVSFADSSIIFA